MKKWIVLGMLVIFCGCMAEEYMLTELTFCAGEPSDRSYDQKLDATYMKGETVWIYVEAFGFLYEEEGSKYMAKFDANMEVVDDSGSSLGTLSQHLDVPSDVEPVYIWLKFWIDSTALAPGAYTARITVTDLMSGEAAVSEGTFTVVSG
jgi:hypothetical protein